MLLQFRNIAKYRQGGIVTKFYNLRKITQKPKNKTAYMYRALCRGLFCSKNLYVLSHLTLTLTLWGSIWLAKKFVQFFCMMALVVLSCFYLSWNNDMAKMLHIPSSILKWLHKKFINFDVLNAHWHDSCHNII